MNGNSTSILLIGESDVGKTHYGAQLLRRLNLDGCTLRMSGAPQSIEPFEAALEKISLGLAADHTPGRYYADSVWPIVDETGTEVDLVWPDYGGEQMKNLLNSHRLPASWRKRATDCSGWLLMLRPTRVAIADDALTRSSALPSEGEDLPRSLSAQARLVELLQMLLFVRSASNNHACIPPPLVLLLSCFDEVDTGDTPREYLKNHLPLIDQFLKSNWPEDSRRVFGLSALGRALSPETRDEEFAEAGPASFGYVVLDDGTRTLDLTVPVLFFMDAVRG